MTKFSLIFSFTIYAILAFNDQLFYNNKDYYEGGDNNDNINTNYFNDCNTIIS